MPADICVAPDLDEQKWPARQAVWFIKAQKDDGRRAKDVPTATEDIFVATHAKVYAAYEELCRQGGLVDFAELLLRSHELWLERQDILEHYQRRFAHLLVDEFQDTNRIQYAWLRVLAGKSARVWAVGDDDQSIYGWRGAKIENIHHFQRDFAARRAAICRHGRRLGCKRKRCPQPSPSSSASAARSLAAFFASSSGRAGVPPPWAASFWPR